MFICGQRCTVLCSVVAGWGLLQAAGTTTRMAPFTGPRALILHITCTSNIFVTESSSDSVRCGSPVAHASSCLRVTVMHVVQLHHKHWQDHCSRHAADHDHAAVAMLIQTAHASLIIAQTSLITLQSQQSQRTHHGSRCSRHAPEHTAAHWHTSLITLQSPCC